MKSNKRINLLSTAIIGLTLCACGGGGGGGGGDEGAEKGNAPTTNNSSTNNSSSSSNSATTQDLAPSTLSGYRFDKGYGNVWYAFSGSSVSYSFGSSINDRYTGGYYSYKKTGANTGRLSISDAENNSASYLPYFEVIMSYSSDGYIDLKFSKSGNTLSVTMDGTATMETTTTDRTSTPYKTTRKSSSSSISGTWTVKKN